MYCELQDFGRCCFCMPLRRGVIAFGYVNLIFSICMIALYSVIIASDKSNNQYLIYHGAIVLNAAVELCIIAYVIEVIFHIILLYGAHMKKILFVKIFYYFAAMTVLATLLLQIIDIIRWRGYFPVEEAALTFAGLCFQLYLILLVRSLLKKLEIGGPQVWENQLHQIVEGEIKVELNGVYNPNSVPINESDRH